MDNRGMAQIEVVENAQNAGTVGTAIMWAVGGWFRGIQNISGSGALYSLTTAVISTQNGQGSSPRFRAANAGLSA